MGFLSNGSLALEIYASQIKLGSMFYLYFLNSTLLMINLSECDFPKTILNSWD
jgi:hypothetical protein